MNHEPFENQLRQASAANLATDSVLATAWKQEILNQAKQRAAAQQIREARQRRLAIASLAALWMLAAVLHRMTPQAPIATQTLAIKGTNGLSSPINLDTQAYSLLALNRQLQHQPEITP